MMWVFLATSLLLLVANVQSSMLATARVHQDSSTFPVGDLTFTQNDANSPVVISGRLLNLKPNTVHVCRQLIVVYPPTEE